MQSKLALRGRRINSFIELWCLVASGGLEICVSSTSFQKNDIGSLISSKKSHRQPHFIKKSTDPDDLIIPSTQMTNTSPFLWNGSSKIQFFADI
jgi:hypothetical protein